jgi:hypothetical protein
MTTKEKKENKVPELDLDVDFSIHSSDDDSDIIAPIKPVKPTKVKKSTLKDVEKVLTEKPKRERTEKQKASIEKMLEARRAAVLEKQLKKKKEEEELTAKLEEYKNKIIEKKKRAVARKLRGELKKQYETEQRLKENIDGYESAGDSDESDDEIEVKKTAPVKKVKKEKVIINNYITPPAPEPVKNAIKKPTFLFV